MCCINDITRVQGLYTGTMSLIVLGMGLVSEVERAESSVWLGFRTRLTIHAVCLHSRIAGREYCKRFFFI